MRGSKAGGLDWSKSWGSVHEYVDTAGCSTPRGEPGSPRFQCHNRCRRVLMFVHLQSLCHHYPAPGCRARCELWNKAREWTLTGKLPYWNEILFSLEDEPEFQLISTPCGICSHTNTHNQTNRKTSNLCNIKGLQAAFVFNTEYLQYCCCLFCSLTWAPSIVSLITLIYKC